jgi:signal transduction histidine kinase/ActR/RegA family two-component response regulator
MIPLESLPDAVVVVDQRGRILNVNSHTEELLGYSRDELVGQPVELLVPHRVREQHAAHRRGYEQAPRVRAMGATGATGPTGPAGPPASLSARHKSGREVPVEIMLSPGPDDTVVAVVRDITRRRELERFRDEYVGYISHDLKNPLSVITLQARVLGRRLGELGLVDDKRALDVISNSAGFIDRMVREMLEMSYLESKDVRLVREPANLADFLKAVLERTVSTSDRWRVHLEVRHSVTAVVDANRVERVVVNFVQNALKHAGSESSIVVRLEARDGKAVVSVIDRGPGLSAEEAAFVFDKYRRTRSAERRDGLGLGLYISRKIVEAHDGQIGVDTAPGQGARFWFAVPQAMPEAERAPFVLSLEPQREDHSARLRGVRALIVDDEANAVSALAALLGAEGLEVAAATNGTDAMSAARTARPDVVVLDVEMPDVSGLVLLQQLRDLHRGVPAVLMTGFQAQHAGIAEARKATGAAYVGKPVDVDELLRVVGRLLANSE